METSTKLKLAKGIHAVQEKKVRQEKDLRDIDNAQLEGFLSDLSDTLNRGIDIQGIASVDDLVSTIETFGQTTTDLISTITNIVAGIPDITELNIPDTIELKTITDDALIETLKGLGDHTELLTKLSTLDDAIGLLSSALAKDQSAGQTEEDYLPVRIVVGKDKALKFLENWPLPQFVGGGGTTTDISAIKGFALGQYDTINATYPTTSSELYTYKLLGATVATILVTYTNSTKDVLSSVVKS